MYEITKEIAFLLLENECLPKAMLVVTPLSILLFAETASRLVMPPISDRTACSRESVCITRRESIPPLNHMVDFICFFDQVNEYF